MHPIGRSHFTMASATVIHHRNQYRTYTINIQPSTTVFYRNHYRTSNSNLAVSPCTIPMSTSSTEDIALTANKYIIIIGNFCFRKPNSSSSSSYNKKKIKIYRQHSRFADLRCQCTHPKYNESNWCSAKRRLVDFVHSASYCTALLHVQQHHTQYWSQYLLSYLTALFPLH